MFPTSTQTQTAGEEMAFDSLMVFTGNANPELAHRVAKHLDTPLGNASVTKFSDGEVAIELLENVRGRDVFILQPTCAPTKIHNKTIANCTANNIMNSDL